MDEFTLPLYAEILACLLGAALIGFLTAWFMQRSRTRRRLGKLDGRWQEKLQEVEQGARQDEERLEERLQGMGQELKQLAQRNRGLEESLRKNESVVHKARADAIELNRQQAETQERLQRIIQQKDRELLELRNESRPASSVDWHGRSASPTNSIPLHADDTAASTLAMSGLAGEGFDETLRLDPSQIPSGRTAAVQEDPRMQDDPMDSTDRLDKQRAEAFANDAEFDGASTLALDEETLDQARRSSRSGTRDD